MSFFKTRPGEARAPEFEVLPDGRRRSIRYFELANTAQIPSELDLPYGTIDTFPKPDAWTNPLRLIRKQSTDELAPKGRDPRPLLVLTYEELPATDEIQVGNPAITWDQYNNEIVTIDSLQYSAGTAVYAVPGITAAPSPNDTAILRNEERTDDGTLRRIQRVYITGGLLSDGEELKFGGKLKLRTLKSLRTEPATPSGYTRVTVSTEYIRGLPLYSYGYANGSAGGGGGVISTEITYNQSSNQGTTGGTVTTIKYITDTSVTSNPITSPSGSTLIAITYADEGGFRVWTGVYAKGAGIVLTEVETRNGGKLVLYHRVALGSAPATPTATIAGTVTLFVNDVREADGYQIFDYRWAEGHGVVAKSTQPRDGGLKLETWVSLGTGYDASFMLPAGILVAKDQDELDGATRWTVSCMQSLTGGDPTVDSGGISGAIVTAGGSGYTAAPTVAFSGGGGTGAAATAVLSGGSVTSLTLTPGSGTYTSPPPVTFSGGGGSGAAAVTTLAPTSVATLTLTAGGSGYTSVPTVYLAGGAGSGAGATATLSSAGVASATVYSGGSGYTAMPTVAFTGGGGTGATATAAMLSHINGLKLTAGGSGYSTAPTVTISGGGGTGATAIATIAGGAVVGLRLTSIGSFTYTSTPTVSFSGGGGTGAAATAIRLGCAGPITVNAAGSGYTSAPTVTISGGGGSGAAAIATISGGAVTGVWFTDPGINYTSTPTVAFSGGGIGIATGTPTVLSGAVNGVTMTAGGSGYTSPPTVTFTPVSGGSGAAGTAVLTGGVVTSVTITNGGSGYSAAPTCAFSGGGISLATATSTFQSAWVSSVTMTAPGSGYTSAPTVAFSGGGGTGAAATAILAPTSVASVTLIGIGGGFTSLPTVTFSGDGVGASATATLTAALVGSIAITDAGSGYTTAPTVTIPAGSGGTATATATIATSSVASVTITNAGTGYTSNPTVAFSGGAGTGAAATAVRAGLTYEDLEEFVYPGRAKLFTVTSYSSALGPGNAIDVFLSPPQRVFVNALHVITYQTSPLIGALTNTLWNPSESATVRAVFTNASGATGSACKGLEGYRSAPASVTTVSDAGNGACSILGTQIGASGVGVLTISGGPPDPGGSTWTLHAQVDPAFQGFDGTQYYRKTVIVAPVPAQTALPV